MRIFECRPGDAIRIGDEVEVRVLEADGPGMRLGIECPRDVILRPVERNESRSLPDVPGAPADSGDD